MTKQTKTPKARTQVKDVPKKEKKLTKEEQKKVKGGAWYKTKPLVVLRDS